MVQYRKRKRNESPFNTYINERQKNDEPFIYRNAERIDLFL